MAIEWRAYTLPCNVAFSRMKNGFFHGFCVAIYHLSATTISRSSGRSVVAAIAYRAAERIIDERTGLVHDYTAKHDVIQKEILLPEGAPNWMGSRDRLWNAVELGELHKDAQLARELTISLPRELCIDDNWMLVKTFVQGQFVFKGIVADVCFHLGDKSENVISFIMHTRTKPLLLMHKSKAVCTKMSAWSSAKPEVCNKRQTPGLEATTGTTLKNNKW